MERLIKEKKQAVADAKEAEKKMLDSRDLRERAEKNLGEKLSKISELHT